MERIAGEIRGGKKSIESRSREAAKAEAGKISGLSY